MTEPPRDVLSWFWSPLCAIGAHGPAGPNAQVCVSVFGASIVPERPRLIVALTKTNYTHDLVLASGSLAISLLSSRQLHLLGPLGLRSGRDGPKLSGLDVDLNSAGDPRFPGAVGWLDAEVITAHDHGDSTAFLCAIRARQTFPGDPLPWADARELVGADLLQRWTEKTERERRLAHDRMLWPST